MSTLPAGAAIGESALQSGPALLEQPEGVHDVPEQRRQWMVGDPMPLTVTDSQLADMIGICLTTFYARKRRGDFAFLELQPQLRSSNTKYSGLQVAKWLRGDNVTPGAPRAHFGSARDRGDQLVAVAHRRTRRTGRPRKDAAK